MFEALRSLPTRFGITGGDVWTVALVFVASFVGSLLIVTFLAVRMPADYLSPRRQQATGPLWLRVLTAGVKNVLGVALIGIGIVLSLPGVPGQGFLTILVGLMLTDIPGVRRLERAIARRPGIRKSLNALRARFGRPPIATE